MIDLRSRILVAIARAFLAIALARQRCLDPLLLTGLQIKRVPLNLLDNVFLHDLALEASERAFERFTILHLDFGQLDQPSFSMIEPLE